MPAATVEAGRRWRGEPADRDKAWLKFYEQHKGKIDAAAAKEAFTSPAAGAAALARREVHDDGAGEGAGVARAVRPADRQDVAADPRGQARTTRTSSRSSSHPWTVLTINPPPGGKK